MKKEMAQTIKEDTKRLLKVSQYRNWSAERHLQEGITLLKRARTQGQLGMELTSAKMEEELRAVAYLDGYDMRESRFVDKVLKRLAELQDDGEAVA